MLPKLVYFWDGVASNIPLSLLPISKMRKKQRIVVVWLKNFTIEWKFGYFEGKPAIYISMSFIWWIVWKDEMWHTHPKLLTLTFTQIEIAFKQINFLRAPKIKSFFVLNFNKKKKNRFKLIVRLLYQRKNDENKIYWCRLELASYRSFVLLTYITK